MASQHNVHSVLRTRKLGHTCSEDNLSLKDLVWDVFFYWFLGSVHTLFLQQPGDVISCALDVRHLQAHCTMPPLSISVVGRSGHSYDNVSRVNSHWLERWP